MIFDNLLEPLKNVMRLTNKFKMDFQVPPFWKLYEKDPELLDHQQKLNDGCYNLLSLSTILLFLSLSFFNNPDI